MPLDPLARQKRLQTTKPVEHQNIYETLYGFKGKSIPCDGAFLTQ